MNRFLKMAVVLFVAVALSACGRSGVKPPAEYDPGKGWKLSWSDEFNGTSLDTNIWNIETGSGGWGNAELECYTASPKNLKVVKGCLVITALREQIDYTEFTSGRINSYGKYYFNQGKIVARIKMPYGEGMWPAFWMLGDNRYVVGWPACGEIDIMEMRGGKDDFGDGIVHGSFHRMSHGRLVSIVQTEGNMDPDDPDAQPAAFYPDFHYFEVEKDEHFLRFRLDGREYNTIDISDKEEFRSLRQSYYLLLNLAVGGKFTKILNPEGIGAEFPQTMEVDWIRVYTK